MATDISWMESAVCRQTDPDMFFPEKHRTPDLIRTINAAKRVCVECPVKLECLTAALAHNEAAGIWGGHNFATLDTGERRELRKRLGVQILEFFEHGTESGHRAHYRRGETPCLRCSNAARVARKARDAANA
jgi:WhiB family redox-sensing transcriptional regulator